MFGPDSYIYGAAAKMWSDWLSPSELATLVKGGYYTTMLGPKLRLIALQTVYYYKADKVTAQDPDPAGQFEWMEKLLQQSVAAGERVYIAGHVPPGCFDQSPNWCQMNDMHLKRYVSIVNKYAVCIVAQFYGHLHSDSFRIVGDGAPPSHVSAFEPKTILFLAPSLSPHSMRNNPAVRQYT